jgi:hypothetical protein
MNGRAAAGRRFSKPRFRLVAKTVLHTGVRPPGQHRGYIALGDAVIERLLW